MNPEASTPPVFIDPFEGDTCGIGIVGQIGSGKTFLTCTFIRTIWRYKYDIIVWISPTYHLQDFSNQLPNAKGIVVIDEFSNEILETLKEHQLERLRLCNEEKRRPERMLLILDDNGMSGRKLMKGGEMLDEIITRCRHLNMTVVQLAQRYTMLSPTLRMNLRFLVLFADPNKLERENLWRFHSFIPNRELYFQIIDKVTEKPYSWVGIETYAGKSRFFNKNGYL
jgi:hypothetical protein